jgi:hypothetical protein
MWLGLAGRQIVTKKSNQHRRHSWMPIVCAMTLSIVVAACAQTSRPNQGTGVAATSDPLVLSGVGYTQGDATTQASNSKAPPASADIVAAPAGGAVEQMVSSTPLPQTEPAPAASAITASQQDLSPPATAGPGPATTADGYPNINLTPKQPQSSLLTPEERAKLIEELNALAGRSGAATQ